MVEATDLAGNVAVDATTDELTIDTQRPLISVDDLFTNNNRPTLTGTLDDPTAEVSILVNGVLYQSGIDSELTITTDGSGTTWSLDLSSLPTPLDDGVL